MLSLQVHLGSFSIHMWLSTKLHKWMILKHRMTDDIRIRNDSLAKPHPYKVGDSVLLSTKYVNLSLSYKKLSPTFIGSFTIRSLLGTNTVRLNYS